MENNQDLINKITELFPPASSEITSLIGGLAKFQSLTKAIAKTKNGHNYKYADHAEIYNAISNNLTSTGLAVNHRIYAGFLVTSLYHTSGEFMNSFIDLSIGIGGNSRMTAVQELGSSITYNRRYALLSILGLAVEDEDNDGSTAPKRVGQQPNNIPQIQISKIVNSIKNAKSKKDVAQQSIYFKELLRNKTATEAQKQTIRTAIKAWNTENAVDPDKSDHLPDKLEVEQEIDLEEIYQIMEKENQ